MRWIKVNVGLNHYGFNREFFLAECYRFQFWEKSTGFNPSWFTLNQQRLWGLVGFVCLKAMKAERGQRGEIHEIQLRFHIPVACKAPMAAIFSFKPA